MFLKRSEGPWTDSGGGLHEDPFTACVEEIASLRFSASLAAQFADSPSQSPERQEELRARLIVLRRQYAEKIDEMMQITRSYKRTDSRMG
jgi:hypothetical protein